MVVITIDGASVAYDGTTDVEIVITVNGADAAWKEEAEEEYKQRIISIM